MKTQAVRAAVLFMVWALSGGTLAQAPAPEQSRISSPVRPQDVDPALADPVKVQRLISGAPAYRWRHGCGPTAVGMVIGWWDCRGFDRLFLGDAGTQTPFVDSAIASANDEGPSSPEHYEYYATPEDYWPQLLQDAWLTNQWMARPDDCVADLMRTSRSNYGNFYGWSWTSDVGPAFEQWVCRSSANYTPSWRVYYMIGSPALTFDIVKSEIDGARPMVFLVDTNGDGATDHFVTVIGYDDALPADPKYVFYDTWDTKVHSAQFRGKAPGISWGVWGGWTFSIEKGGMYFTEFPRGGWFQIGDALELSVAVADAVGDAQYQWEYGPAEHMLADIPGETSNVFATDLSDTAQGGWYRCRAWDTTLEPIYTPAVHVEVFDALPCAGKAALTAGWLALSGLGVRRIRRRGQ